MQRRNFIRTGTLSAISIAAIGSVQWDGKKFIGSTPTTTDILGPFYRPGAPLRSNIIPPGFSGPPVTLRGVVSLHHTGGPVADALVEVWQCDPDQVYDNTSDDFRFRGATRTDKNGRYAFTTLMPVPYEASKDNWRPAHIHMRVSGKQSQDIITQIYFEGDPHLEEDSSAKSADAVSRILPVKAGKNGEKEIVFDVVLSEQPAISPEAMEKIGGLYQMNNGMKAEFYAEDDLLFVKINGQLMEALNYKGDNTFQGGMGYVSAAFTLATSGETKVLVTLAGDTPDKAQKIDGTRFLKYPKKA